MLQVVCLTRKVHLQVAAMWAIDRERPIFDELINLLDTKAPLPAVTHATYAEIVAKHMDLLAFRSILRACCSLL